MGGVFLISEVPRQPLTSTSPITLDPEIPTTPHPETLISQIVFVKSFLKSQFPHKSVNSSFIITNMKNKLTDLRGNFEKRLYKHFLRDKSVEGSRCARCRENKAHKTVKAVFWPWLEPFSVHKSVKARHSGSQEYFPEEEVMFFAQQIQRDLEAARAAGLRPPRRREQDDPAPPGPTRAANPRDV